MKNLYLDTKKGIYRGTSVSFMVLIFGALGIGLFFFIQNFIKVYHILGAVEPINEPTLEFILFWATDFFFVIMALVTAYSIAGIPSVAPTLALSIYFSHFTFQSQSAEHVYSAFFTSPYGYQKSTAIGYMGYLIMSVLVALLIRILYTAWNNAKPAIGRFFDKIFNALRKKIKLIPADLEGITVAEAIDLFVFMLVMPVISCAVTYCLIRYGIELPFAALSQSLETALTSLVSSNVILGAVVIGLLVGFDLIGPISLAAYGVATAAYLDSGNAQLVTIYSACFVTVGWTAFFGALWCKVFKKGKTDTEDFNMATSGPINAFFENLKLTTAFAMPMAARSPFAYIPGYMVGSAVTGLLMALFKIVNTAYIDGSLPKYMSAEYSYSGVDQTYAMLYERGELYMGFSLPLRSGEWLSCRIPTALIVVVGAIVGGFVIMGLRVLQCKLLEKRGIDYGEFKTDITIELRTIAKRFAGRFKGKDVEEADEVLTA